MSTAPIPDKDFNALQHAAYQLAACTDQIFQQIEQQQTLTRVIDKIRSSLDLETILNTTVTEIRQILKVDRVGVFQFTPDTNWDEGEFIAEDVGADFISVLAAKVRDHCFVSEFALYYTQGWTQAIADIHNAGLTDCYLQILTQFQIRANLVVPVLKDEKLWGLLCIHQCSAPRRWQLPEIEFVRKIANYFAVVLQQADYLEQIKQQATLLAQTQAQEKALARQKAFVKITNRIRQSLQWEVICQTATDEVRQLLETDRVTIYRFNPDWTGDFLFESVGEAWKPLVGASPTIADTHLMETQGGRYANNETFAIPNIYEAGHSDCHVELLEEFQARAYAIAPIFQGERLWGLLSTFQNDAPRHWQADEVELLAQMGEQIGIALQQAEYVQHIQTQSIDLEQTLEELQQSQIQLIQNEKMASLGQLIAGIAHEINNPANFIYGNLTHMQDYAQNLLTFLQLYQHHCPMPHPEVQRHAEELDISFIQTDLPKIIHSMKVGTDRIRQIVLSLRNFSRLEESEVKTVNIHEGLDSTLLILGHRLKACGHQAKKVEVIKTYGEIPPAECYPAQLNQVFMNLLANALDALEEAEDGRKLEPDESTRYAHPKIWISTQQQGNHHIEIRIRDNGMGMNAETQAKIFDLFFTTKPVGKGTGLGLAISKRIIVEKHAGAITVDSTLGQGTEFVIRLPRKAP